MELEEMRTVLQREGWTLRERTRYRSKYIYVSRRKGTKVTELYLATRKEAEGMSPEELVAQLYGKLAEQQKRQEKRQRMQH